MLGLISVRSIVGRTGVLGRSLSDDLLNVAGVSMGSAVSPEGRRMYSCKRSVAGRSPNCLITFFRRSSSIMDCKVLVGSSRERLRVSRRV